MAQRLAVLLAVASILVVVCAAEYREATASKYERKPHVRKQRIFEESESQLFTRCFISNALQYTSAKRAAACMWGASASQALLLPHRLENYQ